MSPYRQRVIYEGHPELSFYQLHKDTPLKRSKKIEADEKSVAWSSRSDPRRGTIHRYPDAGRAQKHLFDAFALLWTARRVHGHAALRIPKEPVWGL